jgi:Rod binding domain-containing protein
MHVSLQMGSQPGLAAGSQQVSQARTAAAAAGVPGQTPAVNPRLVRAAHEFEGQMMKELLQPMMQGDGLGGDDDDGSGLDLGSGSGSGGALSEFASEALGQALSERGGFGIADQIIRELSPKGNHRSAGKVTSDLHGNTVMRSLK